MKILHTADWHLGKKLYNKERLPEQAAVLEEIHQIAETEDVDAILIAGDLFDAMNPGAEATDLCYKMLKRMSKDGSRPIIAIAGNHDSAERFAAPEPLARACGIILIGHPNHHYQPFTLDCGFSITHTEPGLLICKLANCEELRIITTPFTNELRLRQALGTDEAKGICEWCQDHWLALAEQHLDNKGVNILMSHLYIWSRGTEAPEEDEGEKPIKIGNASLVYSDLIPSQVQYVALGHLHRSQQISGSKVPIWYSGSPLAYSFSEAGQQKKVHIISLKPGAEAELKKVDLHAGIPLLRHTATSVTEAVAWISENAHAHIEIKMITEEWLMPADITQLQNASKNLVNIIPLPVKTQEDQGSTASIDETESLPALFAQYFEHKTAQKPNDAILQLLNEIIE